MALSNDTRNAGYKISQQQPTQALFEYPSNMAIESSNEKLKENQTVHIKRPMNAFMLWSQAQRRTMAETNPKMKNSEISCALGKRWKELSETDRAPYVLESQKLREDHLKRYPDFKYRPRSKKAKRGKINSVDASASEVTRPRYKPNGMVYMPDIQFPRNTLSQRTDNDNLLAINSLAGPNVDYLPSWTYSPQSHRPVIAMRRQVGEIGSLSPYDLNPPLSPTSDNGPPEHPPVLHDQRRNYLLDPYQMPRSREYREYSSSNSTNYPLYNEVPVYSSGFDYNPSEGHYVVTSDYPALQEYTC